MEQGTGKGLGGGWTLRSSSLSTLWKWLACERVQSVEKVFFESLPAPMYFPISARMIIKVNSPWKNTCQYASCTFFSLYSRKAKFLRLARERCRWTELYLKLAKIFADRVLISRGPFEDRVRFAFAGDCTLAIISTRHSGRRFIVTNVTVSYD